MKRFKEFIKKKVDPILVAYVPVHGKHAKKQEDEKDDLKEGTHPPTSDYKEWRDHNDNHHLGSNEEEVHKKLHNDAKFLGKPNQHHAVQEYTLSSWETNAKLIKDATGKDTLGVGDRHEKFPHKKEMHEKIVSGLDDHLKESKLEHDIHLYHGTGSFDPGKLAKQHPDGHIKFPNYLSTTLSKKVSAQFSSEGGRNSHTLHIQAKKGQTGSYLGSHSYSPHERELLLPRNTTLKVHPTPTIMSSGHKVWHAHIVEG